MKIFKCDICGRKYTRKDQDFDLHDIGEFNICCESCAWVSYETAIETFKAGLRKCKTKEEAYGLLDILIQIAIAGPVFKFYNDCKKLIKEKFK